MDYGENMLRLENIKIREELSSEDVLKIACNKNHVKYDDLQNFRIFRKSIDARNKEDIFYNYTIDICVKDEKRYSKLKKIDLAADEKLKLVLNRKSKKRPVIIGMGPAGLFCGLILSEYGLKPIIVEQGKRVEDRQKDVDEFIETGKLNTRSNIQFGEGGAGTFSDGKLTSGIHDPLCRIVLNRFVEFGAPEQITYVSKPHIGTDNLVKIVSNIRNHIISNGGEVLFNEKVIDFNIDNGILKSVITEKREIYTDTAVLAIGHSARDTFEKLYEKNIKMEKKNFSVGVRIEHSQKMVNEAQYGNKSKLNLPAADYKLAYHNKETGRSCYTFCMCPGGFVMASSSEENTIVVNRNEQICKRW